MIIEVFKLRPADCSPTWRSIEIDSMRLAMITGLANMTPVRLDVSELGKPDDEAVQLIITVALASQRLSLPFELANPDESLFDALERCHADWHALEIICTFDRGRPINNGTHNPLKSSLISAG